MKAEMIWTLAIVVANNLCTSAAIADTYSTETTTTDLAQPMTETRETRTIETSPSPTVVREEPVIINQPAEKETVVVKKHSHHLLNLGVVKVF
jgi:hypothetical protein